MRNPFHAGAPAEVLGLEMGAYEKWGKLLGVVGDVCCF